jgi:hypothetical protein
MKFNQKKTAEYFDEKMRAISRNQKYYYPGYQ